MMEERIQKFSKVIYILAKIGRICFSIAFCIGAAAFIWLLATGKSDGSVHISEHVTVYAPISGFTAGANETEQTVPVLGSYIGYILISCFFLVNILKLVQKLFGRMMVSRTPFEYENAHMIKKISIWLIVYTLVPNAVAITVGATLNVIYNMSSEFDGTSNGTSIFVALIFFCLAEIFEYGCELQKQADETL